ncbi:MAG: chromosomal replication initiator DnaA [Alphaproteobacteria bacterium]|nr:chromosomal replication initiator DnaA [Alphaproteobacteria bacterium]
MTHSSAIQTSTTHLRALRQPMSSRPRIVCAYRKIIESAVSQVFAISLVDLGQQTRGQAHVASARQVAMYLAHVACGLSFTEIGGLFKRDRTTVAHACSVVEDRRDDVLFDSVLELLECAVLNMASFPHQNDFNNPQD